MSAINQTVGTAVLGIGRLPLLVTSLAGGLLLGEVALRTARYVLNRIVPLNYNIPIPPEAERIIRPYRHLTDSQLLQTVGVLVVACVASRIIFMGPLGIPLNENTLGASLLGVGNLFAGTYIRFSQHVGLESRLIWG